MAWLARLHLQYSSRDGPGPQERTVVHARHEGPLRVMKSLYPEGPAVCHTVLIHPPSGLVGGDTLELELDLATGCHGVVTTPGATRFYRSTGASASQSLLARLEPGARLEWLPLENIAYSGCQGQNRIRFELAAGAELMAWDVTALGLPASGQAIDRARRDELLEAARQQIAGHDLAAWAGVTAPNGRIIVLRVLSEMVEPAMDLLRQVRGAWRELAWHLPALSPRVWQELPTH